MTEAGHGAIFLDRDGVINRNRADHVKSWAEFEFLPGVLLALRHLAQVGWPIVVVSNQAAIGRGLTSVRAVDDIHRRMASIVDAAGGRIDAVLYCPHRPEEKCLCRKPNPGLLLRAAQDLHLDLACSYLVGDAMTDIVAAQRVGAQPLLVTTGRGQEQLEQYGAQEFRNVFVVVDLLEAVNWIMTRIADEERVPMMRAT
jgi:D-glycero-D-manno-heptose 1,7-bisphosphate phosphatase